MTARIEPPRRDEVAIAGELLSLRYLTYLSDLTDQSNDVALGFGKIDIIRSETTIDGASRNICVDQPLMVRLPTTPLDDTTIYIKITEHEVLIHGNGKTIDGETTVTVSRPYTCIMSTYSQALDAWFIL